MDARLTVIVDADNTFSGTGHQYGTDGNGYHEAEWTIDGEFLAGNKVSYVATRAEDGLVITLNNETMGDNIATVATTNVRRRSPSSRRCRSRTSRSTRRRPPAPSP